MQTHKIRVSEGRDRAAEIRRDLFIFPEVIDVFVTSQPDALVVVFVGRPRLGEWVRALRSLGYDIPSRRQATPPPAEVNYAGHPLYCYVGDHAGGDLAATTMTDSRPSL